MGKSGFLLLSGSLVLGFLWESKSSPVMPEGKWWTGMYAIAIVLAMLGAPFFIKYLAFEPDGFICSSAGRRCSS